MKYSELVAIPIMASGFPPYLAGSFLICTNEIAPMMIDIGAVITPN